MRAHDVTGAASRASGLKRAPAIILNEVARERFRGRVGGYDGAPVRHAELSAAEAAVSAASRYLDHAVDALAALVAPGGAVVPQQLAFHQHAVHGVAWVATCVEALRQTLAWASRLDDENRLSALDRFLLVVVFGEYLQQLRSGIPMSQVEIARPADLGLEDAAARLLSSGCIDRLIRTSVNPDTRWSAAQGLAERGLESTLAGDDSLDLVREQFHRFADEKITPHAQGWHERNALIPLELIQELAELGVFGITLPREWGGSAFGKLAMCVISEELSRGYIGVGSLGTRSEIAGELLNTAGTSEQKRRFLPGIVEGEILPTIAFSEPDFGSDLAHLKTRAELVSKPDGTTVWKVFGAKTWVTHAARTDLMVLLVRTDPGQPGYQGLSILLAEKPRGNGAASFPAPGMSGNEIEVLGYRGMREYEIGFDGFEVPAANLLGGEPGRGFKHMAQAMESGRIQTAARSVGMARNALELGLDYALDRRQFGKAIFDFPRVHGKLVMMAAETVAARELAYFAAREKDRGRRCDLQAGMAKLLAGRVAWSSADAAVQIHGGTGYALESPVSRVLCDARVLSIFEGASEIQATVIARNLLARRT